MFEDLIKKLSTAYNQIFNPEPIVLYGPNYRGSKQQKPQTSPSPSPIASPSPLAAYEPSTGGILGRNPNIAKATPRPEIAKALNTAAAQYELPAELLHDIAFSESSFNPGVINTTEAGRAAGNPQGLFQFTDGTWEDILNRYNGKPGMSLKLPNTNRQDPLTNALAAAYLIKMGQLGKWDASQTVGQEGNKNAWGQYYSDEELKPFYKQTLNRR